MRESPMKREEIYEGVRENLRVSPMKRESENLRGSARESQVKDRVSGEERDHLRRSLRESQRESLREGEREFLKG